MNKAERLDEILIWCMGCCDSIPDEQEKEDLKETKEKLLAIFMECVPIEAETNVVTSEYNEAWNNCRAETLRNLEELRK